MSAADADPFGASGDEGDLEGDLEGVLEGVLDPRTAPGLGTPVVLAPSPPPTPGDDQRGEGLLWRAFRAADEEDHQVGWLSMLRTCLLLQFRDRHWITILRSA